MQTFHRLSRPVRPAARPSRGRGDRSGVVILELLIGLPVLVVLVLAIIEFGLILAIMQHTATASRLGAKIASEQTNPGLASLADNLRMQIDAFLVSNGIQTGACRVILQTNAVDPNPLTVNVQQSVPAMNACDCAVPTIGQPDTSNSTRRFVRVTVCVPVTGNVPDLLGSFGFTIDGMTIDQTTTYRYELTP